MSICDHCYAPGHCCKAFTLSTADGDQPTFWIADGIGAVIDWLAEYRLPFRPTHICGVAQDKRSKLDYAWWWYSCPRLRPDGRCSRYDDRPELCRTFEAGGDSTLCVHARMNTEAGDPSAPFI